MHSKIEVIPFIFTFIDATDIVTNRFCLTFLACVFPPWYNCFSRQNCSECRACNSMAFSATTSACETYIGDDRMDGWEDALVLDANYKIFVHKWFLSKLAGITLCYVFIVVGFFNFYSFAFMFICNHYSLWWKNVLRTLITHEGSSALSSRATSS